MKQKQNIQGKASKPLKFLLFIACCGFFAVIGDTLGMGALTLCFSIFFGGIAYWIIKRKIKLRKSSKQITKQNPDKQLNNTRVYDFVLTK